MKSEFFKHGTHSEGRHLTPKKRQKGHLGNIARRGSIIAAAGTLTAGAAFGQEIGKSSKLDRALYQSAAEKLLHQDRLKASLVDYYLPHIVPEKDSLTLDVAKERTRYRQSLYKISVPGMKDRLLVAIGRFFLAMPKEHMKAIEEANAMDEKNVEFYTRMQPYLLNQLTSTEQSSFLTALAHYTKAYEKYRAIQKDFLIDDNIEDIVTTFLDARTRLIRIIQEFSPRVHEALDRVVRAESLIRKLPPAHSRLQAKVLDWFTLHPTVHDRYPLVVLSQGEDKRKLLRIVNKKEDSKTLHVEIASEGEIWGLSGVDALTLINNREYRDIIPGTDFWDYEWNQKKKGISLNAETLKLLREHFKTEQWVKLGSGYRVQKKLLPYLFELMDYLAERGYYVVPSSSDEGPHTEVHAWGMTLDMRIYNAWDVLLPPIQEGRPSRAATVVSEIEHGEAPRVNRIIEEYKKKKGYLWVKSRDEYTDPSDRATGPHFHLDFSRAPEQILVREKASPPDPGSMP